MGGPLPVNIVCGYLGAGKTTLLNDLLARATQRIAVMVNDFGAVQIDAGLIAGASGGVVQLTNGCICCSMDGDLYRAFEQVFARRADLDRLVIEASGVAEPHRLSGLARAEPDLVCERVVTLACADSFVARLGDPRISRVVEGQVAGADLVLISRADLAAPAALAEVETVLAALNPAAQVLTRGAMTEALLSGPHTAGSSRPAPPGPAARGRHHDATFRAVVVPLPAPVDRGAFAGWFAAAPGRVHRAKGFVRFAGDEAVWLFQYASGRLDITPQHGAASCVGVFIGPDLTPAHVPAFAA